MVMSRISLCSLMMLRYYMIYTISSLKIYSFYGVNLIDNLQLWRESTTQTLNRLAIIKTKYLANNKSFKNN